MTGRHIRRATAILVSAALLASLTVATVASPGSAAKPRCQGFKATIVGTKKGEVIRGTAKRDIIVARGGDDRIYGKGGNDVICAGGGNDVVFGGPGADRLWGQTGHDRLNGNVGPDFLAGQVGNDTINGGIGVDTCFQGTGTGPVSTCERPAPPPPPGPSLIPLTGILAVAYSDIDGLDGYSTGDVLIARLMDGNGDGQPSAGDTVEMGRYPLDFGATAFGDWLDRTHVVTSIPRKDTSSLRVATGENSFLWFKISTGEAYQEDAAALGTAFDDGFDAFDDRIQVETGSPSFPRTPVSIPNRINDIDDRFVDVELDYPVP